MGCTPAVRPCASATRCSSEISAERSDGSRALSTTKAAGKLAFAPRNVAHTSANHSGAPARYVLVCTPAGFERHWARIAAEAAGIEPPRWALQPIPDVTVVGPQIPATT